MPGQRPIAKQESACISNQLIPINIPVGATGIYRPIFTASRRTAIDEIILRYLVANGAAATGVFVRTASGVAPNGGSAVTVTGSVDFNSTINTNYSPAFVLNKGVPSENIMEEGDTLWLVFTGTIASTLGPISGHVRVNDKLQ